MDRTMENTSDRYIVKVVAMCDPPANTFYRNRFKNRTEEVGDMAQQSWEDGTWRLDAGECWRVASVNVKVEFRTNTETDDFEKAVRKESTEMADNIFDSWDVTYSDEVEDFGRNGVENLQTVRTFTAWINLYIDARTTSDDDIDEAVADEVEDAIGTFMDILEIDGGYDIDVDDSEMWW